MRFYKKDNEGITKFPDEKKLRRRLSAEIEALEKLAFNMTQEGQTRRTQEELKLDLKDEGLYNDIVAIGVIRASGEEIEFNHLSLQEFFAAQHMAKALSKSNDDPEHIKIRTFFNLNKFKH